MKKWEKISLICGMGAFGISVIATLGVMAHRLEKKTVTDSNFINYYEAIGDTQGSSSRRDWSESENVTSFNVDKIFYKHVCWYYIYYYNNPSYVGGYWNMGYGYGDNPPSATGQNFWNNFEIEHVGNIVFYQESYNSTDSFLAW